MTQFADRHTAERKTMGFPKALKRLDSFNDFVAGRGQLGLASHCGGRVVKASGALWQEGRIRVNTNSLSCRLTGQLCLKLGSEINCDGRWYASTINTLSSRLA